MLNSGVANLTSLLATNGANSALIFNGGTLTLQSTTFSNGAACVVGNGASAATLALQGGVHSFANGLTIAANAALAIGGTNAIGSATVNGNLTLQSGAVLDCDFNATTNDWVVVNGTVALPALATLRLRALDASTRHPIPVLQATANHGRCDRLAHGQSERHQIPGGGRREPTGAAPVARRHDRNRSMNPSGAGRGGNSSENPAHFDGVKLMLVPQNAGGRKDYPRQELPVVRFDWKPVRRICRIPEMKQVKAFVLSSVAVGMALPVVRDRFAFNRRFTGLLSAV